MTFDELPQEVKDTFKNAFYGRHDINVLLLEKNDLYKKGKFLQSMKVQSKINDLYRKAAEDFCKEMEREVDSLTLMIKR